MTRRGWLAAALVLACGAPARAHTPYGQWSTYRRKHLLVGCHRADPRSYALAKSLVATLDEHLPAARARVARAPDARRLASLLGTDQLQLAVLDAETAKAMAAGRDGFEPYGETALRGLAQVTDRCLVARADVPDHHAWLVARALDAQWDGPCAAGGMAMHAGARAWRDGLPLPTANEATLGN